MKHDWEYKKLGEVCDIINGKNQRNVESLDGSYPIMGSGGIMGYAKDYLCNEGTTIIGRKGTINRPIFVKEKFWNVDTAFGIQPKEGIDCKFVYYVCKSIDFNRYDKSVTIPSLVKSDLLKIPIPVPPLPTQRAIVAELDTLNEMLDKKRQQLKELDTLAQSIFYDMFGDPVENEKGWEVKELNTVCDVRDGTHDSPKYIDGGDYILITSKNIVDGKIDYSNVSYITKEDYDAINKRSKVDDGDIIMAMIGTIGKPIIVKMEGYRFCIKNVALIKFLEDSLVSNIYIQALLSSTSFAQHIISKNQGGTQKFVALGTIRKLEIPIPPLSLQQSFAQKIEAIEKQKELINASIKEVETLFNATMDKYFG
ncbi:MAG: restriction endonuclease subunit S [Bacteroidales bacterium]|nr:restriction endonuclease subunit S [Bacteroidales bacterium]